MPILQIRKLPEKLYKKLLKAAQREKRSLSQQAILSLERGLAGEETPQARRQGLIKRIKKAHWPDDLPSPVTLIREDRKR